MSTVLKTNPVGIDTIVNKIQPILFTELTTNFGWSDYEVYHRIYLNPKDGQVLPERYTDEGNYEEVLFDDTFNATSFFVMGGEAIRQDNNRFLQKMSIVFQMQLDKLYTSISHRADEEAKQDIILALIQVRIKVPFDVTRIIMGVDEVYRDLSLSGEYKKRVKLDDLSFFNVLKVDLDIEFNYNKCGFTLA